VALTVQEDSMSMLRRAASLACAVALLATGCSGIRVSQDYDPNTDFSGLRTWYWMARAPSSDPRVDNDLIDGRVRDAVERHLGSRGYRRVPTGEGDFGVGYHLAIQGKIDVQTIDRYYGYGYGGWYGGMGTETYVRQYDEGTLILDVVDSRSQQLVWRGTGQAEVHQDTSPEQRTARIQEAVDKILAQFPPQPK
jgi:hypothetical protein